MTLASSIHQLFFFHKWLLKFKRFLKFITWNGLESISHLTRCIFLLIQQRKTNSRISLLHSQWKSYCNLQYFVIRFLHSHHFIWAVWFLLAGEDVHLDPSDVHAPAVLIKKFLREMPEPVLTFNFYDVAVDICCKWILHIWEVASIIDLLIVIPFVANWFYGWSVDLLNDLITCLW